MIARRDQALTAGLWLLAIVVVLVVLAADRESLVSWEHNLTRLNRSFALAAGAELYPEPGTGIALLTLYPPLGAVAYLPATWLGSPSRAIAAGLALSAAFILLPVGLLLAGRSGMPVDRRLSLFLLLLFVLIAINVPAIDYVLFSIHVDAPTLGLALGSCAALVLVPAGSMRLATAALLVVLTLWTKQVGLFLAPSLALFLWLDEGWRTALRFCAWLAGLGLASALPMTLLFGSPAHLFEHLVVLPSRHPWYFGGGPGAWLQGLRLAAAALLTPLAIALASFLPWLREPTTWRVAWRSGGRLRVWWLLWLTALLALPTSILARIKEGGDINSFSAPATFLVVGAVLCLRQGWHAGHPAQPDPRGARLVAGVLLVSCLPAALFLRQPEALWAWSQPLDTASLPHEIAYRYAKAHPGEAWFPRLATASYLAEGRLYHTGPGLKDLERAGVFLEPNQLRRYLPPDLRIIAFAENGYQSQVQWLPLDLEPMDRERELPGFALFRERITAGDEPPTAPSESRP